LSASFPPQKYPKVKAVKNTEIRLAQTKIEFPKKGAKTLLPTISNPIRTAPEKKATSFIISIFPPPSFP